MLFIPLEIKKLSLEKTRRKKKTKEIKKVFQRKGRKTLKHKKILKSGKT